MDNEGFSKVIEYIDLGTKKLSSTDFASLAKFREEIKNEIAGQSFIVNIDSDIVALMIILDTGYKFSEQMVLQDRDKFTTIFDHISYPNIGLYGVNNDLFLIVQNRPKINTDYCQNLEIDVDKNKLDSENSVEDSIKLIQNKISPTFQTVIHGSDKMLILFAQYTLYGASKKILFQSEDNTLIEIR